MIQPTIKELREKVKKATPKWCARENKLGTSFREFEIVQATGGILFRSTSYGNMGNDADFISTFNPQLVNQLLDDLEIALNALNDLAGRPEHYNTFYGVRLPTHESEYAREALNKIKTRIE